MEPRRGLQEQRAGVAAQGNPERVQVHDFPDPTVGKAIPYGVYRRRSQYRLSVGGT